MLGPYEIQNGGRSFFGNVPLRELHYFDRAGSHCVMDVERMAFHAVSPRLAAEIDRIAASSGALVSRSVMAVLRRLGLVADPADDAPPDAARTERRGEPPRQSGCPVEEIALFLAQECNMACAYCYGIDGNYGGAGLMSEDTARQAVDWLVENSRDAPKVGVSFFGGEPLLNFPLLKTVVAYTKEKASARGKLVAFSLTTNGSLLNDDVVAFLREENVLPLISFDGPPEYQDRQRPFKGGGGSHATVLAGIEKLRQAFPRLSARGTVWGDADPVRMKEGMEEAGIACGRIAKASPVVLADGRTGGIPDHGSDGPLLRRMKAYRSREAEELLAEVRSRDAGRIIEHPLRQALAWMVVGRKRHYGCGIGKGLLAVSVDGNIYPCHRFVGQKEACLGHISDYRSGGRNDYHRAMVLQLPDCHACWARYLCGGGCLYENKARTGDVLRPDPRDCAERKASFEGLIHLVCQLKEEDKEYLVGVFGAPDRRPQTLST